LLQLSGLEDILSSVLRRATVRAAQALARALLQDVKEIVHSSKDEAPVDLPCEIQRLAEELPRPKGSCHLPARPEGAGWTNEPRHVARRTRDRH
jgi:hypothetical protein